MARSSLKNVAKLIDVVNKDIPIEEQFLQDLKTSIEKANNEPYKPSQTIKPSSFNCIRNAYYQLIGVEPEESKNTYNLAGICESGTDRHIRMQQNIERMKEVLGVDCEYIDVAEFIKQRNLTDLEIKGQSGMETKLYSSKYNLSFMTDGIVKYKSRYYIFEFKTEIADKFYKRTGVDNKHFIQAIIYSIAFNLDEVLFLYENRNDNSLKCYLFKVTDKMKHDVIQQMEKVLDCAKNNIVPAKPENIQKNICSYCNYRNQCQKDN